MRRARSIRRAQALHPYGPGAILDLGQESFVVLDSAWNSRAWRDSEEIRLPRLEGRGRANAPDGFRLPPIMKSDAVSAALMVQRFPAWLFCPKCRRMWRWGSDEERKMTENNQELPRCLSGSCESSILVPMRYVAACTRGHLTDVDWWKWAHSKVPGTEGACDRSNSELFFVSNGSSGSSLRSLSIKCGKCGARRDLEDLQRGDLRSNIGQWCSGRQPWQARDKAEDCKARLKVLLRSETAVHFADTDSALDLEESEADRPPELDLWLRQQKADELDAAETVDQLALMFKSWARSATSELDRHVESDEIREAVEQILSGSSESVVDESDPMLAEWEKLSRPSPERNSHAPLRVVASRWGDSEEGATDPVFRLIDNVMLVERLREVRALKGFTRVNPPGQDETESEEDTKDRLLTPDLKRAFDPEQKRWKPAIEVFGEGVFIGFPNDELAAWEEDNRTALDARLKGLAAKLQDNDSWISARFGRLSNVLARFVMVHTFSHLFIRQLSYESGYNAASIRERLYVFADRAGILIYTADGDSEGSLGGLVRQGKADRAPNTIKAALERAAWCSNDPICMEMPKNGLEGMNRAACHACALAPETSCSHLNILLDRQLVIGDGDGVSQPKGYFKPVLDAL